MTNHHHMTCQDLPWSYPNSPSTTSPSWTYRPCWSTPWSWPLWVSFRRLLRCLLIICNPLPPDHL
jgi:hypothetical protein